MSAGIEPVREDPKSFLVHRLNHSATTTSHQRNRCAQDRRKMNRIAGDSNAHRIKDILPDDIAVKCLPISDENM
ncbi:hypothetical protein DPMN_181402 [Dreissena polymorpha]|uniref:Uncharacterized protein n=1 Tax=Dreissena polymorpha TaxID=45954 RepID=A0A9D4I5A2_DREPO|nr:hypothetical protein DPMN_181402 [Dreissena polymorpha]